MQFRHFLITGLMVGAAIFLPHHAFAMNNELGGQQVVQQGDSSVETNIVKQDIVPEAVTEPAMKSQDLVQQPPPILQQDAVQQAKGNIQSTVQKTESTLLNLPDQAKDNVQGTVQKTTSSLPNLLDQTKSSVQSAMKEAAIKTNGFVSGITSTVPKNSNLLNDKKTAGNSAVSSLHIAEMELKLMMLEPKGEFWSKNIKGSRKSGLASNRQEPVNKGDIPQISQVVNPQQQSNGSAGPSNNRDSQGSSSKNLMDHWFDFHKYNQLKHVQLYFSRRAFMKNQWVNAPPSPPPQKSSF